jgi:hypothetical protein
LCWKRKEIIRLGWDRIKRIQWAETGGSGWAGTGRSGSIALGQEEESLLMLTVKRATRWIERIVG